MGRWSNAIAKNANALQGAADKTDKTRRQQVSSVSSVRHSGKSENFSGSGAVERGTRPDGFVGFVSASDKQIQKFSAPEPNPAVLAERVAMAAEGVPQVYADAFARLQLQRPAGIDEAAWLRAVDDAGLFLDGWGEMAAQFDWSPSDLFDVPRDGRGGLVRMLQGEAVRAIGPEHGVSATGRVFDRLDRSIWPSAVAWNAAQRRDG